MVEDLRRDPQVSGSFLYAVDQWGVAVVCRQLCTVFTSNNSFLCFVFHRVVKSDFLVLALGNCIYSSCITSIVCIVGKEERF